MPQYTTATSGPSFDTNSFTNEANALLASTSLGQLTSAQNWERLRTLLNTWVGHTHSVTDVSWVSFGNTSTYPTTSTTSTTSSPGLAGENHAEYSGNQISSAWVNDLINQINAIRTHSHSITDQSLP
jgi:hypothetical protein